MTIEPAVHADELAIRQLLASSGLPVADWSAELTAVSVVVRDNAGIAGIGAVERRGSIGLLRSVAVARRVHGGGIGRRIVEALEVRAREEGLNALYLLTTTARDYFMRLGYQVLAREEAPAGIRSTAQFGSLCPASSTLMVKIMTDQARSAGNGASQVVNHGGPQ